MNNQFIQFRNYLSEGLLQSSHFTDVCYTVINGSGRSRTLEMFNYLNRGSRRPQAIRHSELPAGFQAVGTERKTGGGGWRAEYDC